MIKAYQDINGNPIAVEMTAAEIAEFEAARLAEFEASWQHKDRPLRVFMCDSDYIDLIKAYPQFALYPKENGIPLEEAPGGQYLYLFELFDEHRQMFKQYASTIIETKL